MGGLVTGDGGSRWIVKNEGFAKFVRPGSVPPMPVIWPCAHIDDRRCRVPQSWPSAVYPLHSRARRGRGCRRGRVHAVPDSLSMTPRVGGETTELAGHRITVYRKQADGGWLGPRCPHADPVERLGGPQVRCLTNRGSRHRFAVRLSLRNSRRRRVVLTDHAKSIRQERCALWCAQEPPSHP